MEGEAWVGDLLRIVMSNDFSVLAILSAFNEEDVIEPVIQHLMSSDISAYLIDDGSTDATVDIASAWLGKGLRAIERFGPKPEERFDWEAILHRKEAIAREYPASWYIHHDADEIREGPWPGLNLRQSIEYVDSLGFNCIDFRVIHFRPIDDGFRSGSDPAEYFLFYEDAEDFDQIQLKCWKAAPDVDLAGSGGHEAQFEGRRVFPIKFLLRHYPIRGALHGQRKVFDERLPRFREEERARGWHVQYNRFADGEAKMIFETSELKRFDREALRLELMVENRAWSEQRVALAAVTALAQELQEGSAETGARLNDALVWVGR
jgi:hypothetical protein